MSSSSSNPVAEQAKREQKNYGRTITRRRGITCIGIIGTRVGALRTWRAWRTNTRRTRNGASERVKTTGFGFVPILLLLPLRLFRIRGG